MVLRGTLGTLRYSGTARYSSVLCAVRSLSACSEPIGSSCYSTRTRHALWAHSAAAVEYP